MRKLLNKPWFVAVMALIAIALVASSVMRPDKDSRHVADNPDDVYGSFTYTDQYDEPSDELEPCGTDISAVRRALAAMVTTDEEIPSDPFDDDSAELVAEAGSGDSSPTRMDVYLSAIWAQGDQTFVLVNNLICVAGDTLGDLTIESTSIEGIWVAYPDGHDFIPLGRKFTWMIPAQLRETNPTLAFNEN